MGLSAGAGAFLIGTVLGDTRHRDQIARLITPVRDVFAALFFVSIGMLVNMGDVPEYFGTAMIVTGVLIAGKVLAATVGTFLTGHDGETSLRVGTAMPQPGEFSLAIARAGSEHASVGAQLYPIVTISTLLSSFIYPLVFKSPGMIGAFIGWLLPARVKNNAAAFSAGIATARRAMAPAKPASDDLVQGVRSAAVSFGIIGLVVVAGVLISNAGKGMANGFGISSDLIGVAILSAVVTLTVPASIVLWRVLVDLGTILVRRGFTRFSLIVRADVARVLSTVIVSLVMVIAGIWLVTQLLEMMPVDDLASPVPALVMVLSTAITATAAMKIHSQMDKTFRGTMLGDVQGSNAPTLDESTSAGD
jgi:CPA2 family monovalent cation:H+ antiporter-2